jgi:CheY-like chemotaxis protein
MRNSPGGRPAEILLVEDNPADVRLTIEVFNDSRITNHISVVTDGEEALDFLYKRGNYAGESRPDLILLDLNCPKGRQEVLSEIKADRTKDHPGDRSYDIGRGPGRGRRINPA